MQARRDFALRQVFDIAQDQEFALFGRNLCQRLGHRTVFLQAVQRAKRQNKERLALYIAKWQLFWSINSAGASQAADYTQGLYAGNLLAACAGMAAAFAIVVLSHPAPKHEK